MRRRDSAAIVSNTSELLPEPETPVKTVSRRLGMSTSTSRRLFSRAPRTRMAPQLGASEAIMGGPMVPAIGSGLRPAVELRELNQVPDGVLQHGDRRARDLCRRHRELGARGGQAVVLLLH